MWEVEASCCVNVHLHDLSLLFKSMLNHVLTASDLFLFSSWNSVDKNYICIFFSQGYSQLGAFKSKANWLHMRDYMHRPTDYRNADKFQNLRVVVFPSIWQAKPLILTLICTRPWPLTLTPTLTLIWKQDHWWQTVNSKQVQSLLDLDYWPTAFTYIASLAKVHAKDEGRRSNKHHQIYYLPDILIEGSFFCTIFKHFVVIYPGATDQTEY